MTVSELTPQLIAQTPQWLVFSKPAGWLTIPGRGTSTLNGILSEWAKACYGPVWIVHRIDRETSGLVLFARTEKDHRQANSWFQNREVKKTYLCLAQGTPLRPVFKIQDPIEGAPSLTQVEVKERYSPHFLARVTPRTGRRHQIRIHLANRGHPLLGDVLYGGPPIVPRVALHAAELELPSGEKFTSPLPDDFLGWVEHLKKRKEETLV